MGHKISKEQIDPGVKDHIMSFVGDVADLETEVNTDIISAVNSLMVDRVDNAENMGKLANAIGEPVTANHSVDEVVEGLGEMLSTFKTNMMNSGVMVESSDKFKQLIDKIKGLTEGEGNKGIQFAMGDQAVEGLNNYDLDFTPNYIFVEVTDSQTVYAWQSGYLVSNLNTASFSYSRSGEVLRNTQISITDISNTSFNINIYDKERVNFGKWYAIGVGEEDTTLRDSLASILQEEGVIVTEEDDMASLISKVDEEFDRQVVPAGNATIDNVVAGKTFMNSSGELLTGNIVNQPAITNAISVGKWETDIYFRIPHGVYLTNSYDGYPEILCNATDIDSNIKPENIISGKSICGINGTANITSLGGFHRAYGDGLYNVNTYLNTLSINTNLNITYITNGFIIFDYLYVNSYLARNVGLSVNLDTVINNITIRPSYNNGIISFTVSNTNVFANGVYSWCVYY